MLGEHKYLLKIMAVIHREFFPHYMCSIVSWMMVYIAKVLGYNSRCIGLIHPHRVPTEGHTICEIEIDGKWICFDVSYNVCLYKPAAMFDKDCIRFYPPEVRELKAQEFLDLFSNITYFDNLEDAGYK